MPELWKQSAGEAFRVGVADTGTSLSHPDLIHAYNDVKIFTGSKDDVQGHGSHCTGIIAARANDLGVVGVAPACRIYHAKVLGDDGSGSDADIVKGIEWLASQGVKIISMSLGSDNPSPYINSCLDSLPSDIDIVVAAGNSGPGSNTQEWPSRHPRAIAVAAIDRQGKVADFSSRGPHIAVGAPGVDILSTFKGKQYARLSGTSMATPFVAGLLALARAQDNYPGAHSVLKMIADQGNLEETGMGIVSPSKMFQSNSGYKTIKIGDIIIKFPDTLSVQSEADPTFTPS